MKKFLILILLLSFCIPQKNSKKNNKKNKMKQTLFSTMNEEAKMTFYQSQKINPEIASIYQLALPIPFLNLGYSYSNNWKKGAMSDIAIVLLMGLKEHKKDEYGFSCQWSGESCYEDIKNIETAMGIVTLFKVFKANQLADKYNRKMFKRLFGVKNPNFSFNFSKDNKTPELSLIFPLN